MKKRRKKEPTGPVTHTVMTTRERTYERRARNKEGTVVRRIVTEKIGVQLQEFNGSIYRNGAKIA